MKGKLMSLHLINFSDQQIDQLFSSLADHYTSRQNIQETSLEELEIGKNLFKIISSANEIAKLVVDPTYDPIRPVDDFFEAWFKSMWFILSDICAMRTTFPDHNIKEIEILCSDARIFLMGNRLNSLDLVEEYFNVQDTLTWGANDGYFIQHVGSSKRLFLPKRLSKYLNMAYEGIERI